MKYWKVSGEKLFSKQNKDRVVDPNAGQQNVAPELVLSSRPVSKGACRVQSEICHRVRIKNHFKDVGSLVTSQNLFFIPVGKSPHRAKSRDVS